MPPKTAATMQAVKKTLQDEAIKWAIRITFTTVAALAVFALRPVREQVLAVWRAPEAIAQVQATQSAIREQIVALRREVSVATGEDRVIRQPPGQSYIEEPVRAGETVVMIMAVERTTLGLPCRLREWVPLFTDSSNVTIPGARVGAGPVQRQLNDDLERLRVEMVAPRVLRPGRVEVYLSLEYDCAGATVIERSDVVSYQLLPGDEG